MADLKNAFGCILLKQICKSRGNWKGILLNCCAIFKNLAWKMSSIEATGRWGEVFILSLAQCSDSIVALEYRNKWQIIRNKYYRIGIQQIPRADIIKRITSVCCVASVRLPTAKRGRIPINRIADHQAGYEPYSTDGEPWKSYRKRVYFASKRTLLSTSTRSEILCTSNSTSPGHWFLEIQHWCEGAKYATAALERKLSTKVSLQFKVKAFPKLSPNGVKKKRSCGCICTCTNPQQGSLSQWSPILTVKQSVVLHQL